MQRHALVLVVTLAACSKVVTVAKVIDIEEARAMIASKFDTTSDHVLNCPPSIVAKKGAVFACDVVRNSATQRVKITFDDDDGGGDIELEGKARVDVRSIEKQLDPKLAVDHATVACGEPQMREATAGAHFDCDIVDEAAIVQKRLRVTFDDDHGAVHTAVVALDAK